MEADSGGVDADEDAGMEVLVVTDDDVGADDNATDEDALDELSVLEGNTDEEGVI